MAHQLTAIGIKPNKGKIIKNIIHLHILVVYENMSLSQTALQMTNTPLTAGHGINRKSIDNLIGITGITQRSDQLLTGGQIKGAHVVAHGEQTIELVLGVCKAVLVNKLIDGSFKGNCNFQQFLLCLFSGHRILHIVINLVRRAGSAMANGITAIGFQIGSAREALEVFNKCNTSLTKLHIRSRASHGSHHQQTQGQANDQAQTQNPF